MKKRILKQLYATYLLFWLGCTSRKPTGTNIYEQDWDVLVLLDTCRVDAMREVADEYDYIEDVDEIWSVGSTSKEWVEQTFTKNYAADIADTAYITGNPFSNTLLDERDRMEYGSTHGTWIEKTEWVSQLIKDSVVDGESLGHLEPLWGVTGPDAPFQKSQHPKALTEHTIQASRKTNFERIVSHYMQPHSPYFSSSTEYNELAEYEKHPFRALKQGGSEASEKVWNAYLDNLRYALDSIEVLIENVDGKVVLTADHGELLGDHRMYYHMPGNPHPKLKKVPWVEVEAADRQTLDPDVTLTGTEGAQEASEEQLKALGYV